MGQLASRPSDTSVRAFARSRYDVALRRDAYLRLQLGVDCTGCVAIERDLSHSVCASLESCTDDCDHGSAFKESGVFEPASSPTPSGTQPFHKRCSYCRCMKTQEHYTKNNWKHDSASKPRFCKSCICAYCRSAAGDTREHLVPKSVGGTLTIRACYTCNQKRGNSGSYAPFAKFIKRNPVEWKEGLMACKPTMKRQTIEWLCDHNLAEASLNVLLDNTL